MNTEKFEGHDEGWRTLWLAIAGVMAITLTWNVLMLSLNVSRIELQRSPLWKENGHQFGGLSRKGKEQPRPLLPTEARLIISTTQSQSGH
jgi:hypothetical protein